MGIKDLRTFLKTKKVDCFYTVPLEKFGAKRIAIDSLNWYFCYLRAAYTTVLNRKRDIFEYISDDEVYDRLVIEFLSFNNKLMEHDITPVWIWDGVSKDNKGVTKVERRKKKKEMAEQRDGLYNSLKKMNPLERPYELIMELKKKMINSADLKRIEELKEFSKEVGVCTIIAEDEAENLGSSLAVERIVAGVWSADTDTYPLGCPLVVKGFETVNGKTCINCVFTLKILQDLGFTHQEFRDFCILLGTDFNDRLDRIGPVKSFKLIEKYRCLEEVEKHTQHNLYALKYKEVRPQLASYKTIYNGVDDLFCNTMVNFGELKSKYSRYYNLGDFFNHMINLSKPQNIPKPK